MTVTLRGGDTCACGAARPCPTERATGRCSGLRGDDAPERARTCLTCNGWNPVSGLRRRETTGLVCQTCGWDYGKDGES